MHTRATRGTLRGRGKRSHAAEGQASFAQPCPCVPRLRPPLRACSHGGCQRQHGAHHLVLRRSGSAHRADAFRHPAVIITRRTSRTLALSDSATSLTYLSHNAPPLAHPATAEGAPLPIIAKQLQTPAPALEAEGTPGLSACHSHCNVLFRRLLTSSVSPAQSMIRGPPCGILTSHRGPFPGKGDRVSEDCYRHRQQRVGYV